MVRSLRPAHGIKGVLQRRLSEDAVIETVVSASERYRATLVRSDQFERNLYGPAIEAHGIPVKIFALSQSTRTEIFADTRKVWLAGRLDVPSDPQLVSEVARVVTGYQEGAARPVLPRGAGGQGHCDALVSVCQAVHESILRGGNNGLCVRSGPNIGLSGILTKPL